jgi:FkbM family methyltransferase
MKVAAREAVPRSIQVPLKYWLDKARGRLEPEMALLPALVNAGERVIDVGGNRGSYAYALHRLGARVEVFEPNPSCLYVLRAWAAGKDVGIHGVGLSDQDGVTSLHVPVDVRGVEHDASASMEPHDFDASRVHRVALRRLDDYAFDGVSFIKIDVEGHESRVLAGAAGTLRRLRPLLLVEIEQRHLKCPIREVFDQIRAFGYEGHFLDGATLSPLSSFDPARDQDPSCLGVRGARYVNNFLFLDDTHRLRMHRMLSAS